VVEMKVSARRGVAIAGPLAVLVAGCNLGAAPVVYPSPSQVVDVADMNGDGSLDVVATGPGAYQVLLNDGTGALHGAPVAITSDITTFTLGDVDGDGVIDRVDLNSSESGPTVSLSLGDDTGGFGTPQVVIAGVFTNYGANDVDLVDLDRDGDVEILTAGRNGVQVFSDDGTGTFTRTWIFQLMYGSPGAGGYWAVTASQMAPADVDHDGDMDIVLAAYAELPDGPQPGRFVLFNDGTGRLSRTELLCCPQGGAGTTRGDVTVGDINEDGHVDIVLGYPDETGVVLYLSTGAGRWASDRTAVPTPAPPGDVEVADIDADGHLDLVVTADGTGPAYVLYGDGTGSFPESHEVGTGGHVVNAMALGRVDGGASIDLVFGNDSTTADPLVAVLLNKEGRPQH
jgi:hypothetical protein